nr:acyltransferase domain-containing protein [Tissierella sp.]
MNKDIIIDILDKAQFTKELIAYVVVNFPENYKKKFNQPYHKEYSDNPLLELDPKERLIESLAQLISLKKYYADKGIPLAHLYRSIYDLNYRVERYYDNHGSYGLSEWDTRWLSSLYRGKIFDLGSLRFEISGFSSKEIQRSDYQYMHLEQKWKDEFPEGTPIITIHILKDTDLSPGKVDKSFKLAREFFKDYFPEHDYKAFVCRTWMLYKPTMDILSEDSNIASFSKRFKTISQNQNTKQALDRIYGSDDLDEIKKMEKKSSLQKTAYKNLDKLGVAGGIIYK